MAYKIQELLDCSACIDGKYVIARPMVCPFIRWRLRDAWLVLTGKADAVTFYKQ